MSHKILNGDCIAMMRTLPDASVHCCVTSPPYWGLRDYGHDGQIGLEQTPEAYVARIVEVFREVRRVLRDDGTLWLNIGDSYATGAGRVGAHPGGGQQGKSWAGASTSPNRMPIAGLKPKDLVGIPWRIAFALQADGWWLRQDIIWHKPNPMPESVRDRCTKSHEYVFLLTKSERYFYDAEAVSEAVAVSTTVRLAQPTLPTQAGSDRVPGKTNGRMKAVGPRFGGKKYGGSDDPKHATKSGNVYEIPDANGRRNRRSVWSITTRPYSGAHFATMPPKLAELCILAGTSDAGSCQSCGAPRARVVSRNRVPTRPGSDTKATGIAIVSGNRDPQRHVTTTTTAGWKPTCAHNAATVPCVVLDPFGGSGTTIAVAVEHGRYGIACELNEEYIRLAEDRIAKAKSNLPLFFSLESTQCH